ncbi:MAG: hypothetical protein GYA48_09785 [Chloroflexi bacterium]|nr:hypothetical protein [Chloroflexota bacterium]
MGKSNLFFKTMLGVLLLTSLGCGSFTLFNSDNVNEQTDPILPQEIPTEIQPTEIQPTEAQPPESESEIEVSYVYTDGLVTSLYHLYGTVLDNFVDVTLTNHGNASGTVIVETYIEGYTTKAADTVDVGPGETIEIHQNPRLMAEAVDKLNSEKPGTFHIKITQIDSDKETTLVAESQQILLYSRRDFVWIDGFETAEEYELWAAWVTPTDPKVEELIRAAANYTSSGTMWSGYGGHVNDDNGGVWERLEAIWKAEEDYRLTYISTMVAYGPNTVQRMRLPAEVIEQASGNCVELATLYASATEAMGLETAIIRVPGHAYVAVRIDEENANYYFIETTLIGRASFTDATNLGLEEWNDAIPHFEAQEEGYAWVTIQDAREKGILPIPWN